MPISEIAIRGFLAGLAFSMLPGKGIALSCLQPDIVQSYTRAAEANEAYVVVKGKFRFVAPPRQPVDNDAQDQDISARFEGVALGRDGFSISYSRPIRIRLACAGPWCGWVQPDTQAIAFVEMNESELLLVEGPCPGQIFYDPSTEDERRLLICHLGGPCSTPSHKPD